MKNSYIFLAREKKNIKTKEEEKNTIHLSIPHSFKKLLTESFNDIEFHNEVETLDIINAGFFILDYNNIKIKVLFKYYNVGSNYYLNVVVNEKTKKRNVEILEIVNSVLIGENNNFDSNFISIVSYDEISEYYCNKLFPYLNEFERKLRKTLFNIYTLNFNANYYSATTSKNFQDTIKQKSRLSKIENIPKNDCYVKLSFYSLDYKDIDTLLFTKSITNEEQEEIEKQLQSNKDLSKLDDNEIRNIIKLGKPKTDWERFFEDKNIDKDFQKILDDIRLFRNSIAHCKFISKEQYNNCLKILKKNIKSLNIAIQTTEEKDFINKNIELQDKSFKKLANTMREMVLSSYIPLMENIDIITKPMNEITEKMSEIIKPITSVISEMVPKIPSIELPEIELSKFDIPKYFSGTKINKEIEKEP